MSAAPVHHPDDAVAALIGVTACDADPARGDAAVAELLDHVRAAAGATRALVWVHDPRDARGRLVATEGVAPEAVGALEEAAAAMGAPGAEMPLGEGASAALAQALGAGPGLVLPVAPASRGLVAVAGAGAPVDDPVRRLAVRVGVKRIGGVLDTLRMRDNLERAMAQILATDERMLGRMGLDIHDGPTQQLSVALLEVQLLDEDLTNAEDAGLDLPDTLRPALERIYETVGGALHEMRELIGQLRPAQFEDRRLNDILEDAVTAFGARSDCEVATAWEGPFPVNGVSITQRITLYRILQETLTNAWRHGQARAVSVRCEDAPAGVTLEVRDDGRGFDPEAVQRRRPGMPLARFGLHGMRDRAQILGGSFEIESAPGAGATVRVFLPRWDGAPPEVAVDVA